MKFKIDVKQGIIHINSVTVVKATADVIYLSIDCRAKYPELCWCAKDDSSKPGLVDMGVALNANEDTLYIEPNKSKDDHTHVWVQGLKGDWVIMAEAGRYTVGVVLVNITNKKYHPELDWDDVKENENAR